jgi:hypothetical protein
MNNNGLQEQLVLSTPPELFSKEISVESETFWKRLEAALPPVFARAKVGVLSGGIIASGTMANLDSQGKGPPIRVRIGKHTAYERISFLLWLRGRSAS